MRKARRAPESPPQPRPLVMDPARAEKAYSALSVRAAALRDGVHAHEPCRRGRG
jgi:hypothetical protein